MMKPNSIFCEKVNRKLGLLVVIFFLIMKGFSQVPFEKAYTTIPNPGWMVYQSITHIEKISTTGAFYGVGNLNPTAGGYTNEWSLNLWKLDAYGDTIWVKTLPQSDPGSFWIAVDASLRSDGSMYVLYRQYNPGYDFNGVLLVNASGNIEWNTPITSQGEYAQGRLTQISTTPDGGSIICGSTSYTPSLPYVVKLSATGSIEWSSTSFPNDPGYNKFNDVCITTDSSYIFTGLVHHNVESKYRMVVSKVSQTGNVLWNVVLNSGSLTSGDSIWSEGLSVAPAPQGGALVTGYKTFPGTQGKDTWVFQIDSLGNWPPVWQKMMGITAFNNSKGEKIMRTSDGNYLLFASDNWGNTSNNPQLIKMNPSGNVLWSQVGYYRYFEYNLFPCSITNTDEVLFCGTSSNDPSYARFTHPTSDGIFRAPRLFLPENNAENQPTSLTLKINAPFTIHNFSSYWYQLSIDSNFNGELINQVVDLDTILWIATCIPMANGLDFQQLQYSPSHPDPPK